MDRATHNLGVHITWRAKNLPIHAVSIAEECTKGECFVFGADKREQPVLYFFMAKYNAHKPSDRERTAEDRAQTMRMITYRLEQAIACLPCREGKVSIVVVMDPTKPGEIDVSLFRLWSSLMREQYPERVGLVLITAVDELFTRWWNSRGLANLDASSSSKVSPSY